MAKYVIVGGVAGGAGVAARLRRMDESAQITIFERGDYVSYANCGLPYYAGGAIADRDKLFIMTPQKFKEALNVEVKTGHEVVSLDAAAKQVSVKELASGKTFSEAYDALILSPGGSPLRPPIPGINDPAVMTLWTVPDVDAIKAKIDAEGTKRAVVVGGGFIGLEMAENLRERGLEVTLIEALDQVMNVLDYEMAAIVHEHLRDKGIDLRLKDGVSSFRRVASGVLITLSSGAVVETDLVVLSIGVRPNTAFLKGSGVELAANGAIKVDKYFRSSDPNIRAVGDAIEFTHPILGIPAVIPLAGPANKQARLCADNIVKGDSRPWGGSLGTSIAKVFDLQVACTGASEKALLKAGIPHSRVTVHPGSHAGYYPGALQLTLKVIYSPVDGKLLGAQGVGYDGVDKRMDVVAAFLGMGGSVHDLAAFEQAYAPPFNSAKDPLNMAGFIAENDLAGLTKPVSWSDVEAWKTRGAFLLDVRTPQEFALGAIPGAVNIPHTQVRDRLAEIPRDKPILINCAVGLRGYLAERILRQKGWTDIGNLSGGYRTWKTATAPALTRAPAQPLRGASLGPVEQNREDGAPEHASLAAKTIDVDACGLQCPGPIMRLKAEVDKANPGDRVSLMATDPGFGRDVKSWCSLTGNLLVALETEGGKVHAVIEKSAAAPRSTVRNTADGASLIIFSNDFDKALASFVLANGAAASGKKTVMFFTFWGLSVLRRKPSPRVKKDFMGKMFGAMLPKGPGGLALSKINFGGMGPVMMKGRMKARNVDQLETMIAQAKAAGVRMVACQMSMDIMGLTAEELIDGVEIGGVASYMEAASESGVNLFI